MRFVAFGSYILGVSLLFVFWGYLAAVQETSQVRVALQRNSKAFPGSEQPLHGATSIVMNLVATAELRALTPRWSGACAAAWRRSCSKSHRARTVRKRCGEPRSTTCAPPVIYMTGSLRRCANQLVYPWLYSQPCQNLAGRVSLQVDTLAEDNQHTYTTPDDPDRVSSLEAGMETLKDPSFAELWKAVGVTPPSSSDTVTTATADEASSNCSTLARAATAAQGLPLQAACAEQAGCCYWQQMWAAECLSCDALRGVNASGSPPRLPGMLPGVQQGPPGVGPGATLNRQNRLVPCPPRDRDPRELLLGPKKYLLV
jgi:hypothetical protein